MHTYLIATGTAFRKFNDCLGLLLLVYFLGYDESNSDWYSKESVRYKIVKVYLVLDHQLFVVFLSIEF